MLAEVLNRAAVEFPDRIAYVSADGWGATFRQLDQFSDECAVWLSLHAGVREGDVVVARDAVDHRVHRAVRRVGQARRDARRVSTRCSPRANAPVHSSAPSRTSSSSIRRSAKGCPHAVPVLEIVSGDNAEDMVRDDAGAQRGTAGAATRSATWVHHLLHVRLDGYAQGRAVPRSADPRDRGSRTPAAAVRGARHAQHRVDAVRPRRRHDEDPVDARGRRHHPSDDSVAGASGDATGLQVPDARPQRWARLRSR